MHELFHDVGPVINPLQKHGLAAQGNAGIGQNGARLPRFLGYLARMVEMDIHVERVVFFQHHGIIDNRGLPFVSSEPGSW